MFATNAAHVRSLRGTHTYNHYTPNNVNAHHMNSNIHTPT